MCMGSEAAEYFPIQSKRKGDKGLWLNCFQTERLHLERNIGSRKTIEAKALFSPWGTVLCYLLVKGKQLFAGKAWLLLSSVLLPELGATGLTEMHPSSEGNHKAFFP